MHFSELIEGLVTKHGQGTLADIIGVDGSTLSRFRSGQGTINILALQKIFDLAGVVIVSKEDLDGYENSLSFVTKLWNQERSKSNGNGREGKAL
jgi:hypothetical protein